MVLGKRFPNDSERLAELQASVYDKALSLILGLALHEYRRAKLILGVTTDIEPCTLPSSFDHRTLQWIHDALAAQYRYNHIQDTDLFLPAKSQKESDADFIKGWLDHFIEHELRKIGESNLDMYRDICAAVFFPNPDLRGIEAEDRLYEITLKCFEPLHRGLTKLC